MQHFGALQPAMALCVIVGIPTGLALTFSTSPPAVMAWTFCATAWATLAAFVWLLLHDPELLLDECEQLRRLAARARKGSVAMERREGAGDQDAAGQ